MGETKEQMTQAAIAETAQGQSLSSSRNRCGGWFTAEARLSSERWGTRQYRAAVPAPSGGTCPEPSWESQNQWREQRTGRMSAPALACDRRQDRLSRKQHRRRAAALEPERNRRRLHHSDNRSHHANDRDLRDDARARNGSVASDHDRQLVPQRPRHDNAAPPTPEGAV